MQNAPQDLAHLRPQQNDEIDLGQLIRNLINEWKLIVSITALGAVFSVVIALMQTPIYKIETTLTAPSIAELGKLSEQSLLPISRTAALEKVAEQLVSTTTQSKAFEQSPLKSAILENSEIPASQAFNLIRSDIKLERIDREFYTVQEDQVPELKEITLSIETAKPIEATDFIQSLSESALNLALETVKGDISVRKEERIDNINQKLAALSEAATIERTAQIQRIEEANQEKIEAIEQQLSLLITKATEVRQRQIIQLEEALTTARALNITNPVTWDDLREQQSTAQVFNDLSSKEKSEPLYFRGTKYLSAEITMLKNRKDDSLFVAEVPSLKLELEKLRNDTNLKALKERTNDEIYVAQYSELQDQLANLKVLDTDFTDSQLARIVQPAEVPANPIKPNKKLIAIAGTVLAGFLSLFLALIRIAIRPAQNAN